MRAGRVLGRQLHEVFATFHVVVQAGHADAEAVGYSLHRDAVEPDLRRGTRDHLAVEPRRPTRFAARVASRTLGALSGTRHALTPRSARCADAAYRPEGTRHRITRTLTRLPRPAGHAPELDTSAPCPTRSAAARRRTRRPRHLVVRHVLAAPRDQLVGRDIDSPSRRTTNAMPTSPSRSSGTPTTATAATAGVAQS